MFKKVILVLSILFSSQSFAQLNFEWNNPHFFDFLMESICAHYCRNSKVCIVEGNNSKSVYWFVKFHKECMSDYDWIPTDSFLCPNEDDKTWNEWSTDCR